MLAQASARWQAVGLRKLILKKLITKESCADLCLFFSSDEGPETYAKGTCYHSLVRNFS